MRRRYHGIFLAGLVAAAVLSAEATDSASPAGTLRSGAVNLRLPTPSLAALPVAFVENRGQVDSAVRYYAQGDRYGFYFTDQAIVLAFLPEHSGSTAARADTVVASLQFVGANPNVRIDGARYPALSTTCTAPIRLAGKPECTASAR